MRAQQVLNAHHDEPQPAQHDCPCCHAHLSHLVLVLPLELHARHNGPWPAVLRDYLLRMLRVLHDCLQQRGHDGHHALRWRQEQQAHRVPRWPLVPKMPHGHPLHWHWQPQHWSDS